MHNLEQGQLMNKDYFDSIISVDNLSGKKSDFKWISDVFQMSKLFEKY